MSTRALHASIVAALFAAAPACDRSSDSASKDQEAETDSESESNSSPGEPGAGAGAGAADSGPAGADASPAQGPCTAATAHTPERHFILAGFPDGACRVHHFTLGSSQPSRTEAIGCGEDGRPLYRHFPAEGEPIRTTAYSFDDAGALQTATTRDRDGTTREVRSFTALENGGISIRIERTSKSGSHERELRFPARGGRITAMQSVADGQAHDQKKFKYDKKGRLRGGTSKASVPTTLAFKYDDKGRLLMTREIQKDGEELERTEFEYDCKSSGRAP